MSLAKKPSTALSQDAEVGVKWNAQRGCRASHLRGIWRKRHKGALKVPGAFGVTNERWQAEDCGRQMTDKRYHICSRDPKLTLAMPQENHSGVSAQDRLVVFR